MAVIFSEANVAFDAVVSGKNVLKPGPALLAPVVPVVRYAEFL
jgi:hypothetical protein